MNRLILNEIEYELVEIGHEKYIIYGEEYPDLKPFLDSRDRGTQRFQYRAIRIGDKLYGCKMIPKDIDINKKYGLDGQYICFDPKISDLQEGDVITQDAFKLRYMGNGVFIIFSPDAHDFVPGYRLLKEWKKAI